MSSEALPEPLRLPQSYQGNNMVFIVGCPRSGTTWLQKLLASHPKVHSGPESHLFEWYLGPLIRHWNRELLLDQHRSVGLKFYFQENGFKAILRNFMLQLLVPMASQLKESELFVEKTPDHGFWMHEISEVLPNSRFIHIIRDGRDVVASLLAASRGWGSSWAPKNSRAAARKWTESVRTIHETGRTLPRERFLQVRYEELWNDSQGSLSTVTKFLGLDWDEVSITEAIRRNDARTIIENREGRSDGRGTKPSNEFIRRAYPGGWKRDLNWSEKIWFWWIARKTMEEMGYSCRYPW